MQLRAIEQDLADARERTKALETEQAKVRGRQDALDQAYFAVNSLGGYVDRNDPEAVAYDELLTEVLDVIHRMGGMDPIARRRGRH